MFVERTQKDLNMSGLRKIIMLFTAVNKNRLPVHSVL